jgi:hypothetical protein
MTANGQRAWRGGGILCSGNPQLKLIKEQSTTHILLYYNVRLSWTADK